MLPLNCLPSIVCTGGGYGAFLPLPIAGAIVESAVDLKWSSRLTLTSPKLMSSRNPGIVGNCALVGKGIGFAIGGTSGSCPTFTVNRSVPPKVTLNVPEVLGACTSKSIRLPGAKLPNGAVWRAGTGKDALVTAGL